MKKAILSLLFVVCSMVAKADLYVQNGSSCTFVLSLPGGVYLVAPPGLSWDPNFYPSLKNAYWPSYPFGMPIDDGYLTIGSSNTISSCIVSGTLFKYSLIPGYPTDTVLEIFP